MSPIPQLDPGRQEGPNRAVRNRRPSSRLDMPNSRLPDLLDVRVRIFRTWMNIRRLKRWERGLAICQPGEDNQEKSEKLRQR